MAMDRATTAALLIVAALLAASSAQVAQGICNLSTDGVKACKPAAAIRNPTGGPSAQCCAALRGANLPCLCGYKRTLGGSLEPLARANGVDVNRAMGLPGKCGISLPANC